MTNWSESAKPYFKVIFLKRFDPKLLPIIGNLLSKETRNNIFESLFAKQNLKRVFLVSLFPKQRLKKMFLVSETYAKFFVSCFSVSEKTDEK